MKYIENVQRYLAGVSTNRTTRAPGSEEPEEQSPRVRSATQTLSLQRQKTTACERDLIARINHGQAMKSCRRRTSDTTPENMDQKLHRSVSDVENLRVSLHTNSKELEQIDLRSYRPLSGKHSQTAATTSSPQMPLTTSNARGIFPPEKAGKTREELLHRPRSELSYKTKEDELTLNSADRHCASLEQMRTSWEDITSEQKQKGVNNTGQQDMHHSARNRPSIISLRSSSLTALASSRELAQQKILSDEETADLAAAACSDKSIGGIRESRSLPLDQVTTRLPRTQSHIHNTACMSPSETLFASAMTSFPPETAPLSPSTTKMTLSVSKTESRSPCLTSFPPNVTPVRQQMTSLSPEMPSLSLDMTSLSERKKRSEMMLLKIATTLPAHLLCKTEENTHSLADALGYNKRRSNLCLGKEKPQQSSVVWIQGLRGSCLPCSLHLSGREDRSLSPLIRYRLNIMFHLL